MENYSGWVTDVNRFFLSVLYDPATKAETIYVTNTSNPTELEAKIRWKELD